MGHKQKGGSDILCETGLLNLPIVNRHKSVQMLQSLGRRQRPRLLLSALLMPMCSVGLHFSCGQVEADKPDISECWIRAPTCSRKWRSELRGQKNSAWRSFLLMIWVMGLIILCMSQGEGDKSGLCIQEKWIVLLLGSCLFFPGCSTPKYSHKDHITCNTVWTIA